MHATFAAWHQAMRDLEAAQRQGVAPHLLADAVRRAGETHEAVLRAVIVEVGELKRAFRAAADRTQATITGGDYDLHTRLDAFATRLHGLEQAVAVLQATPPPLAKEAP